MIAVGKFKGDVYPEHVEEFFDWLASRKWKDEDGKSINGFTLLSNRGWLKPIIEKMFSVHIQYAAGEMSL